MRVQQQYTPKFWLFRVDDLIAHYDTIIDSYQGYEESDVSDMALGLIRAHENLRTIAESIKDHGVNLITVAVNSDTHPVLDANKAVRNQGYAIAFNDFAQYYGDHDPKADHSKLYPAGAYYAATDVISTNSELIKAHKAERQTETQSYLIERHDHHIDFLDAFNDAVAQTGYHPAGTHVRFDRSFNHDLALQNHVQRVKHDLDNNQITFKLR